MIAFPHSTVMTAGRQVVLRLPPQMSIGGADLEATIARPSGALWGAGLPSGDLERIDADLVGFWRHVRNTQGLQ
jgi:hypothetical protein